MGGVTRVSHRVGRRDNRRLAQQRRHLGQQLPALREQRPAQARKHEQHDASQQRLRLRVRIRRLSMTLWIQIEVTTHRLSRRCDVLTSSGLPCTSSRSLQAEDRGLASVAQASRQNEDSRLPACCGKRVERALGV